MQTNRRQAARRGFRVEIENARVEMAGAITQTNSGKKFGTFFFFTKENLDDQGSAELKIRATLWEEKAEAMAKALNKRYNVKGYYKAGKPWEKDGKTISTNEFVVSSVAEVKSNSGTTQQAQASSEVEGDDIPF